MRRWWTDAAAAARLVADRPTLWLPGALCWLVTVGWIPLIVAVTRPPNVADLTFLGAAIFTSGAWPWNAVAIGAGAFAVVAVAVGVAAIGEAILIAGIRRRRPSAADVLRLIGVTVVTAAPVAAAGMVLAFALATIAVTEFTSPDAGAGPVLRTIGRAAPFAALAVMTVVIGSTLHAAAARAVIGSRADLVEALASSPRRLAHAGTPGLAQVASVLVLRLAYVAASAVLLATLWTPIGARLTRDGFDLATSLLLVGFVAIWLCLVLAGGALHAWGSVTWTAVLERGARRHRAGSITEEAPAEP
ncbi:hypothetical protein BH23CHL9_BH23CHL9_01000 [soil metagenome]